MFINTWVAWSTLHKILLCIFDNFDYNNLLSKRMPSKAPPLNPKEDSYGGYHISYEVKKLM